MQEASREGVGDPRFSSLTWWERAGLTTLAALVICFGALVEMRSAFMQRRMTDLGVYLRAGWAARSGADIYDVTDANGWHFQYPPLFAILMAPLADPQAGADRAGTVPYAVSVAIWYALSVSFLALGTNALASALERGSPDPLVRGQRRGCRRWWALRVIPLLACLPPIGHTLMRGQVNLLWLAIMCALTAAIVRGQHWRAGLWLAAAACLKVLPLFLLILPLWRRDVRCLAGALVGLIVGLVAIPSAVFGPERTADYYQEYATKLLLPGLGKGSDQSRAKELIEMTANDSQSLMAAMHNTANLDRTTRPPHPSELVQSGSRLAGGILTLITIAAAGWRPRPDPLSESLFVGCLIVVMLLASPVCHLHYFCLEVPLLITLVAVAWERRGAGLGLGAGLATLVVVNVAGETLPNLPGFDLLRDMALAMYPALLLWAVGCVVLWRRNQRQTTASADSPPQTATAAA
jgi:alpha-1,2-mannosyltransferase